MDPTNNQQYDAITLKFLPKFANRVLHRSVVPFSQVQILSKAGSNSKVKQDWANIWVGVLVEECLMVSVLGRAYPSNMINAGGERQCADLSLASSITSFNRSRVRVLHRDERKNIYLEGEVFETEFIIQGFSSLPELCFQ